VSRVLRAGAKFPEGLWEQVLAALKTLERKAGKKFGDPKDPLLVSVRSGAKFSMPGMMDTVLNLGLNEDTAKGLAVLTKNERFALDSRRRFIQMFGKTVKGIDGDKFEHELQKIKKEAKVKTDPELTAPYLKKLIDRFLAIYKEETKREFPSDPVVQLREAIDAVFKSWNTDRAKNLPAHGAHPGRPRHRGQRPDDGVRKHGQDVRHGRRVHAQPDHRREGALRRLPDQRAG